jgi:hypothetical protein
MSLTYIKTSHTGPAEGRIRLQVNLAEESLRTSALTERGYDPGSRHSRPAI